MYIEIDDKSGFCFGVVRAIGEAEKALAGSGTVYSLGDIVHNRIEVQRLERLGLQSVAHEDMERLTGRTLLIRAHGEPPSTYRRAERCGIRTIDATCPVVARLQRRVKKAYAQMHDAGGSVVLLGKRGHAEVVGLTGQVDAASRWSRTNATSMRSTSRAPYTSCRRPRRASSCSRAWGAR